MMADYGPMFFWFHDRFPKARFDVFVLVLEDEGSGRIFWIWSGCYPDLHCCHPKEMEQTTNIYQMLELFFIQEMPLNSLFPIGFQTSGYLTAVHLVTD